jgi:hypothetical protein
MFDPTQLSPMPWTLEEWADDVFDIDNVADNMAKDDAEFFVAMRQVFDIMIRRRWFIDRVGEKWAVGFNWNDYAIPTSFAAHGTIAEAMELMIEADEWLTKKETEGNYDEC